MSAPGWNHLPDPDHSSSVAAGLLWSVLLLVAAVVMGIGFCDLISWAVRAAV